MTKIEKLIEEYEIALVFCGNGENEFSINSIIQTNKTFIEKAKELFKEEEIKHQIIESQPIPNYTKGTDSIKPDSVSYVCDNGQFQVNKHYFFDNIESAQEFYKKERDLIFVK